MSRLPFLFMITGMIGFAMFHISSLGTLTGWLNENIRGPEGWFHIHLFVLGWGTMLAFGAVYQLIHVILGTKIYSERIGYVHYILFTVGLAGLLYGFAYPRIIWIGGFATLTFIGILLFAWNMFVTLFRAAQWNAITISAACSVAYLVLTGVSGMIMGINFIGGHWVSLHERLFVAHIWLGTTGWFGLLIIGFSYKMLPMFYLSHQYPTRLQSIAIILWNIGVLSGTAAFIIGNVTRGGWLALFLLTSALVAYNIHLVQIKQHRHKKNPGPGIAWSVYSSHALACMAIAMTLYTLWFPASLFHIKSVLLSGWIYLVGWVSFTILCYTSKIVPFLWWTYKYGEQAGKPGIPIMADLIDEKKVKTILMIIALLTMAIAAGIFLDFHSFVVMTGLFFSIFSIVYTILISLVFAR